MKIEELEKELKNEKLSSLYLLYGEEKFLLENSLKKIKNLFGECLKGINYITIDDTLKIENFGLGLFFSDWGRFFSQNVPKRTGPNGTFFTKRTVPNPKKQPQY